MTSSEIQKQIDQLEQRRSALLEQQRTHQAALENARAGLVEGKHGADKIVAAQNQVTAIKGAIEHIDGQISQQQGLLAEAQHAEDEAERQAQITRLRAEREAVTDQFNAKLRDVHQHLANGAVELAHLVGQFADLGGELVANNLPKNQIEPHIPSDLALPFSGEIANAMMRIRYGQVELTMAKAA